MAARIFVVEDHPLVRQAYRALFRHEKDIVLSGESATGEEALEKIANLLPDLVLIDISLPGMSGIDLVRELAGTQPQIKTLIVSGHEASVYEESAYDAGATGYLSKDSDPDVLIAAVHAALRDRAPNGRNESPPS